MRLLILADINDLHWRHGDGHADMVLSCGDVADRVIVEAARAHGCPVIFAVKGNHDSNVQFMEPIVDLHLRTIEHKQIVFGGFNGSWRYKRGGHFLYGQAEARALLVTLPPVHVLVSHNAPKWVHDREDEVHCGFEALNEYILLAKPKYLIHGHQHVNRETQMKGTTIIGVYGHRLIEI